MKRETVWILGAGLLLAASPVFAQGDPDASAPPPDPNAAPAAAPAPAVAAATSGGGSPIIDRPLTLAASKFGVYGDLDILHISISETVMGTTVSESNTSLGLHAGFGYGLNDKLTIGAEYALTLVNDFEAKGPLALYGSYSLYHQGKLTIAGSADLTFDFNGETVDSMGMESSTVDVALHAGLGVRYSLTPTIALFTGNPIAPGILGQHLSIGFNSGAPITFDIPVGVALQATPQIYAWLSTDLIDIGISNSNTDLLFKDFIPLTIGAYYTASQNLDVGAYLTLPDLENEQFDLLEFGVAARYYN